MLYQYSLPPTPTGMQQSVEGALRCCSLYCVLSASCLACYFSPEEITAKVEPSQQIPISKVSGTVIHKEPPILNLEVSH